MRAIARLTDPRHPIGGRLMDFRIDIAHRWESARRAVSRAASGVARAHRGAWDADDPLGTALGIIPWTLFWGLCAVIVAYYLVSLAF
jgi:hypothetical protein